MKGTTTLVLALTLLLALVASDDAEAKKRRRQSRRYVPKVTHPMVLWSRTVSQGKNLEERRVAAYKLSQYSQRIFPPAVVETLLACVKDPDVQIKVFCTKAMGNAGTASNAGTIRAALLDRFHNDETLRNTVVRTFIARKDRSPEVHDTFLKALKDANKEEDRLTLLGYFESFGQPSEKLTADLTEVYKKHEDAKTRRGVVKVLTELGKGQEPVTELLAGCATGSKDTPLLLLCLGGLREQAKTDKRSWAAVEKTILSDDADVLLATLDVITVLPEMENARIAKRLMEIIDDTEDPEIQEKAILALGYTGDRNERIVKSLLKIAQETDYDEAIQIAAALSLGQQAVTHPEKAREFLDRCRQSGKTQSLRTACQLAFDDLDVRRKRLASGKEEKTPEPSPSPAPQEARAPSAEREPETVP